MATDNPFALDPAADTNNADTQRRKRIQVASLQGLGQYANDEQDQLQEQPLYGGDVSKNVASPESQEPSQLATERVQRAPAPENASPLLGPEERLGNVLTGEEGQYGPLSGEQRSVSLKDFFGSAQPASTTPAGGSVSNDVGGAGQTAAQAIGYSKAANSAASPLYRSLSNLFSTGGALSGFQASYPGSSFFQSELGAAGIGPEEFNAGLGMATGEPFGGQMGGFGTDLALGGEAGNAAGAAGGLSNITGMLGGGIGGLLTLAGLINSLTSGNMDNSKTGALPQGLMGLGISSLPVLQSLIGPAAAGVTGGLGLSGIGLAATPMLIPAIESIVHMFQDPTFPYNSKNISQYRSRAAAANIPGNLNDYLLGDNDPLSLLGLATGARQLSPNSEIMFNAGGNPWGSDPYNQMLESVLQGDPQATQDFLRSVNITSGETGGIHNPDAQATDTYRRQLAHALGLTADQTQGMFAASPLPDINSRLSNDISSMRQGNFSESQLMDLYNSIPSYGAPEYADFGQSSPYFQDPYAGRLRPEDVQAYQDAIMQYLNGGAQ